MTLGQGVASKGTASVACWKWQEKVHFCVLNKLH